MSKILSISLFLACALSLVSCATPTLSTANVFNPKRMEKVRTTAYSHNEGSGSSNAVGRRLSGAGIRSAAADWSRFPLGTRFRIVESGEEYIIDDYGGALVGTNTIDLYKLPGAMHRWGVRRVDIDIIDWGSETESLRILRPRRRVRIVQRMIASLEKKETEKKKKI
ncbi:MAG: 3D domain-containing protein [Chthoniobacterales bacterium]